MEELADPTSTARRFISEPQFIDPMLLLRTDSLPPGEQWLYELKLDGYRVVAFKRNGAVHFAIGRERPDDFNRPIAGCCSAREPLQKRREAVPPKLPEPVRVPAPLDECVPLHSRPRQDAGDARPRLKIRAQPGSLRMNDTRRNTRRLSWRQRKKLCRSALSFPP